METVSLNEYNDRQQSTKRSFGNNLKAGLAVVAIVLLALSFMGGMQYQKHKSPKTTQTASAAASQPGGTGRSGYGGMQRGNRAIGTVTAISGSSITIANRQGTSSTYAINSSTTVTNNGSPASISDIQSGDTVFITLDSSNTKNASSIALNPSFGGGMGANSSSGSDTPATSTDPNTQST